MKYHDDFQLEARIEENIQRKRSRLRWGLFGVNLIGFLLYVVFVIVSSIESIQEFYLISPFRSVGRMAPHILWIPVVLWGFALLIHLVSVLIESGRINRVLTALAREEEEQIIEAVLQRLAQAEKRKRDTSRLEEHEITSNEDLLLQRIEEQATRRSS